MHMWMEIVSNAGKSVYKIYQLKRAGINKNDLFRIYACVIRSLEENISLFIRVYFAKGKQTNAAQ